MARNLAHVPHDAAAFPPAVSRIFERLNRIEPLLAHRPQKAVGLKRLVPLFSEPLPCAENQFTRDFRNPHAKNRSLSRRKAPDARHQPSACSEDVAPTDALLAQTVAGHGAYPVLVPTPPAGSPPSRVAAPRRPPSAVPLSGGLAKGVYTAPVVPPQRKGKRRRPAPHLYTLACEEPSKWPAEDGEFSTYYRQNILPCPAAFLQGLQKDFLVSGGSAAAAADRLAKAMPKASPKQKASPRPKKSPKSPEKPNLWNSCSSDSFRLGETRHSVEAAGLRPPAGHGSWREANAYPNTSPPVRSTVKSSPRVVANSSEVGVMKASSSQAPLPTQPKREFEPGGKLTQMVTKQILFGAAHLLGQACSCGNVFMPDSLFCRKCGSRRKEAGMLSLPEIALMSREYHDEVEKKSSAVGLGVLKGQAALPRCGSAHSSLDGKVAGDDKAESIASEACMDSDEARLLEDHALEVVDGLFDSAFGDVLTGRTLMLAMEEEACWREAVADATAVAEQRAREESRRREEALQERLAEERRLANEFAARAAEEKRALKAAEAERRRAEEELIRASAARLEEERKAKEDLEKKLRSVETDYGMNEIAALRAENDKLKQLLATSRPTTSHTDAPTSPLAQSEGCAPAAAEVATPTAADATPIEAALESPRASIEDQHVGVGKSIIEEPPRRRASEVKRERDNARLEAKAISPHVVKAVMQAACQTESARLNAEAAGRKRAKAFAKSKTMQDMATVQRESRREQLRNQMVNAYLSGQLSSDLAGALEPRKSFEPLRSQTRGLFASAASDGSLAKALQAAIGRAGPLPLKVRPSIVGFQRPLLKEQPPTSRLVQFDEPDAVEAPSAAETAHAAEVASSAEVPVKSAAPLANAPAVANGGATTEAAASSSPKRAVEPIDLPEAVNLRKLRSDARGALVSALQDGSLGRAIAEGAETPSIPSLPSPPLSPKDVAKATDLPEVATLAKLRSHAKGALVTALQDGSLQRAIAGGANTAVSVRLATALDQGLATGELPKAVDTVASGNKALDEKALRLQAKFDLSHALACGKLGDALDVLSETKASASSARRQQLSSLIGSLQDATVDKVEECLSGVPAGEFKKLERAAGVQFLVKSLRNATLDEVTQCMSAMPSMEFEEFAQAWDGAENVIAPGAFEDAAGVSQSGDAPT